MFVQGNLKLVDLIIKAKGTRTAWAAGTWGINRSNQQPLTRSVPFECVVFHHQLDICSALRFHIKTNIY